MEPIAQHRNLLIKLWPPSQSTRLVLIDRIINNLTTPSILSRKYGLLTKEEAEEDAKRIESAAFVTANRRFEQEPDGDGSSAVQLYAKESSALMVEAVKRGPTVKNQQESIPNYETVNETFFDISRGDRVFLTAEEAEELLKPLQQRGNGYKKIRFSNRSFGLDSACVAVPILAALKNQLTEVDLSDFVAGRSENEALEVMSLISSALEGSDLRCLNLSDNALGEKGIRAFEKLLSSQNNLEELYLMNDGISEEAAKAVCELILSTNNLKILHFHNNMTGDEGAVSISRLLQNSPLLEDFRCSSTRVGSTGGVALAEALATCTRLKKLDLRDNVFGVEPAIALSKSVSLLTDLTEIYLSYLNLSNEGALALANALKDSARFLQVIDMAGNEITSESAPVLASLLTAERETLTKINLSENELGDEGVIVIGSALEGEFPRLTEVDLSTNGVTRAGARVLARAVVGKPGFKLLNINGNFLSDEGVDDVNEIFKNAPGVLGPLDENDPEGRTFDDDDDGDDADGDELGSKLKELEIKQEE